MNYEDLFAECPIINNRIISDITFALRFRNFVEDVQVSDAISEEEQEYLLMIANKLINYQIETATDESELNYLKDNKLL